MIARAALANSVWLTLTLPDWFAFRHALHDPAAAQRRVLEEIVAVSAGTPGFVGVVDDIEPRDWEEFEPLVARAAAGESGVLTREQITHFEPTSGSSAASKLVPSTPLLRRQFNRAIRAWVADLFLDNGRLLGGPAYWSISPATAHPPTSGGIRVGYEDDSEYLGRVGRWLARRSLVVPASVRRLEAKDFQRATLLFLLAQTELRLISIWNPTFLTTLMDYLDRHREELVAELSRGVVVCGRLIRRKVPRNPWPRLGLISCWADAHACSQITALRRWFPEIPIQPKGLIATEAFVSLPFRGRKVLAVTSHFLEVEVDDGRLLRVDELREGDEGNIVVSTGGGLIRYRLGDRIAVSGFLNATPCIEFLGRQNLVSDICGEKLSDAFAGRVLRDLANDGFSLLVPAERGYRLYTEADVEPAALERRLAENPHYDWAVRVGQLQPVEVVRVGPGAAAKYLEVRRSRGQKLGDIKPAALDTWPGWHQALESCVEAAE